MSENKNLESIFELTPDLLEQVSGGVMNEKAENVMSALINALKNDKEAEHTPEETIEFVTTKLMGNIIFEGVTEEEVADYIKTHG